MVQRMPQPRLERAPQLVAIPGAPCGTSARGRGCTRSSLLPVRLPTPTCRGTSSSPFFATGASGKKRHHGATWSHMAMIAYRVHACPCSSMVSMQLLIPLWPVYHLGTSYNSLSMYATTGYIEVLALSRTPWNNPAAPRSCTARNAVTPLIGHTHTFPRWDIVVCHARGC
jgi:hypothetical protein